MSLKYSIHQEKPTEESERTQTPSNQNVVHSFVTKKSYRERQTFSGKLIGKS